MLNNTHAGFVRERLDSMMIFRRVGQGRCGRMSSLWRCRRGLDYSATAARRAHTPALRSTLGPELRAVPLGVVVPDVDLDPGRAVRLGVVVPDVDLDPGRDAMREGAGVGTIISIPARNVSMVIPTKTNKMTLNTVAYLKSVASAVASGFAMVSFSTVTVNWDAKTPCNTVREGSSAVSLVSFLALVTLHEGHVTLQMRGFTSVVYISTIGVPFTQRCMWVHTLRAREWS